MRALQRVKGVERREKGIKYNRLCVHDKAQPLGPDFRTTCVDLQLSFLLFSAFIVIITTLHSQPTQRKHIHMFKRLTAIFRSVTITLLLFNSSDIDTSIYTVYLRRS